MSDDDPFEDDRTTFVRPQPGGRPPSPAARQPPPVEPPVLPEAGPDQFAPSETVDVPGMSPLLRAAAPLLALATKLRHTVAHPQPARLLSDVAQEVRSFEERVMAGGIRREDMMIARYCLCTFLDESALSTPWGANSAWSRQTLLSTFHGETWGGEKFFSILERMLREPAGHVDSIELLGVILLLGFQGQYRVADRGPAKLAELQAQAVRAVRAQRGEFERELSPHWRGVTEVGVPLARYLPVWVCAAGTAMLLLVAYLWFSFSLGGLSDPVDARIRGLGRDLARPTRTAAAEPWVPPPGKTLDLAGFLAPEIQAGLVKVVDEPGKTTITLPGAALFASGSASLAAKSSPLLGRIADALDTVRGNVVVTGHTDSDPIPAGLRLKFASNWELSQARAVSVGKVLSGAMDTPTRVRTDGRADTQPLASNDSADGKALNRRVEIVLLTDAEGA